MADSRLPTEVELVYEVMPCQALRTAQEPKGEVHPCTYFRKWGTYHSYDYTIEGAPAKRGIVQDSVYLGRAPLVPEVLSGCRKAPIMALGINPNIPAWWPTTRRAVFPLFDDYRQYAHYFRYRAVDKVELSEADYARYGGGPQDTPFSDFELNVPADDAGRRSITLRPQPQKMYETYQGLLDSLAQAMGWPDHELTVGEDLGYGNMVASPSAKWTTVADAHDPTLPPMTDAERDGIVAECFDKRRYFLRQLFQSLPSVLLIFSQATADAFVGVLHDRFSTGAPQIGEPLADLMQREIRLRYGDAPDGTPIEARCIFAPHATGDPQEWQKARQRVVDQLVAEAQAGHVAYNAQSKHLVRPVGGCVLCPMLQIGPCDYVDELRPLTAPPAMLTAESPVGALQEEKACQAELMGDLGSRVSPREAWAAADDGAEPAALRER